MRMRAKLFVAFLIVIILPISLITSVGAIIISYQLQSIERSYNVESDSFEVIQNPLHILNNQDV